MQKKGTGWHASHNIIHDVKNIESHMLTYVWATCGKIQKKFKGGELENWGTRITKLPLCTLWNLFRFVPGTCIIYFFKKKPKHAKHVCLSVLTQLPSCPSTSLGPSDLLSPHLGSPSRFPEPTTSLFGSDSPLHKALRILGMIRWIPFGSMELSLLGSADSWPGQAAHQMACSHWLQTLPM